MSKSKMLSGSVIEGRKKTHRSIAKLTVGLGLSAMLLTSGCATQNIQAYQSTTPTLDMHEFFSGQIDGWGMFQGRNGEVKKRFYVDINATHEGDDIIVLNENFSWADGTKSQRIWRLTEQTDGSWKGVAGDVIGEATGKVVGNTLHWNYLLELPVEDKTYKVTFDDWMYLINEDVMLNRSVMKKFGVELGSVTLSMHRKPSDDN
ncbi:DUF3833 domain-containing protein [Psychrobacter sp. MES7-P7E]|uniref:DUF3833 domain-containing protein n=1 Tax=Psychrobacter sp. MES7-P7E TaxID=2058322 RepID=UPI000C7F694B|nr:DUF3833 domain-containing protein [Psychrobacter sp. MES7-P7E]PLT23621.1 DUF3833 domain-containing protein [Psychrobacter sp. MES7-P7E]